ncbi:MAG: hypothetical protein NVS4B3_28260 [Gemmatimonadaceae bacterium]
MALRDAVRTRPGARTFAEGIYDFLHGRGNEERRFVRWCEAVESLPRRQTRVLTWPLVTGFGFLGAPARHVFLKPTVTRIAAAAFGYDFHYELRPMWETYMGLRGFADEVLRVTRDLHPRDMIDAQGFIWVQGSEEYPNSSRDRAA